MGADWARELLENGGSELMAEIKAHLKAVNKLVIREKLDKHIIDQGSHRRVKPYHQRAGSELIQHDFIEVKGLELENISHSTLMISSKSIEGVDFEGKTVFCVGNKTRLAIENAGGEVTEVFENSQKMRPGGC